MNRCSVSVSKAIAQGNRRESTRRPRAMLAIAMTTDIMPFVHVQGTWGEMGRQVGQMFAPLIDRHVEPWLAHVRAETGSSRADALAAASAFSTPIRDHAPFLWEEIEGLAAGAGLPLDHVLLLQARAEVLRARRGARPALECTTFAIAAPHTDDGTVL